MDRVVASSPSENAIFSAISTSSNDVFLAGENVSQFKVEAGGVSQPNIYAVRGILGYNGADDASRSEIQTFLSRGDRQSRNMFEQDIAAASARAVSNTEQFNAAQQNATPFGTVFQSDKISRQMQSVAETIKIQQFLNVSRQMFYVSVGGFDTHRIQTTSLTALHTQLAAAISSFRDAMLEIGQWNNVVVFTASDFGRTVIDNGDGTDHGWGGHHIVTGGAVRGKRIYGDIPTMDVNGGEYTKTRGRLIPTTSVEQYAATMGSWFGLNASELSATLPNLANFNSSNLGFMG